MLRTVPYGTIRVTATVHFGQPTTIGFDDRVSSEQNYDTGRFLLDGYTQTTASGTGDSRPTFDVDGGEHTFTWEYRKDGSYAVGTDSYRLRSVTFHDVLPPGWY